MRQRENERVGGRVLGKAGGGGVNDTKHVHQSRQSIHNKAAIKKRELSPLIFSNIKS